MQFHRSPVPMVPYETAGPLINREVMVDAAWRKIFGMKPLKTSRANAKNPPKQQALTYNERLTISVIAGAAYTHDGDIKTMDMVDLLVSFLDRKRDAVIRILRNLEEAGFIRQVADEDRATIYHWQLRDDSIRAKLAQLVDVLMEIDKVVAIQRAEPENPDAGSKMLPNDIYYNLVVRRNAYRAQS